MECKSVLTISKCKLALKNKKNLQDGVGNVAKMVPVRKTTKNIHIFSNPVIIHIRLISPDLDLD